MLCYIRRTVFDLTDISDDEFTDWDLQNFSAANCRKLVLMLDFVLKSSELFLFAPIIKSRHEDDDNDGDEYSEAFNPTNIRLFLRVG